MLVVALLTALAPASASSSDDLYDWMAGVEESGEVYTSRSEIELWMSEVVGDADELTSELLLIAATAALAVTPEALDNRVGGTISAAVSREVVDVRVPGIPEARLVNSADGELQVSIPPMTPAGDYTVIVDHGDDQSCGEIALTWEPCELESVYFPFDRYDLLPEELTRLEEGAACLLSAGVTAVKIYGHADARGTPAYNHALSEWRADTVQAALARHGIDAELAPLGEQVPASVTSREDALARSRRVEVVPTPGDADACVAEWRTAGCYRALELPAVPRTPAVYDQRVDCSSPSVAVGAESGK